MKCDFARRILAALGLLLCGALVSSCGRHSSSPRPPAGRDGYRQVERRAIRFLDPSSPASASSVNYATMNWKKGEDLVLAYGFALGDDVSGTLILKHIDIEKDLKLKLRPGLCTFQKLNPRWLFVRQGIETPVTFDQPLHFEPRTTLYVTIETRADPACTSAVASFAATALHLITTPVPTPTPPPAPPSPAKPRTLPEGSEPVWPISAFKPENFTITHENKGSQDFKYHVKILVFGPLFAEQEAVEKIYVSVYDKVFNMYVAPWTPLIHLNPPRKLEDRFLLQFTLDQFSAPATMIERQRDLVLTFAINSETQSPLAIRSFELGKYCLSAVASAFSPLVRTYACD